MVGKEALSLKTIIIKKTAWLYGNLCTTSEKDFAIPFQLDHLGFPTNGQLIEVFQIFVAAVQFSRPMCERLCRRIGQGERVAGGSRNGDQQPDQQTINK